MGLADAGLWLPGTRAFRCCPQPDKNPLRMPSELHCIPDPRWARLLRSKAVLEIMSAVLHFYRTAMVMLAMMFAL